jgi:hypothetical protein
MAVGGLVWTGQLGAAQTAPAAYSWQPPAPSQNPVLPQLAAPWSVHCPVGSWPPLAIERHAPRLPTIAHDRQRPSHAVAQQTPCAQTPLAQSDAAKHAAPFGLRPHEPPSQTAGGAQSRSLPHADLQAPVPQANGKHELGTGVTQAPAPSQVDSGVSVALVVEQPAGIQGVP